MISMTLFCQATKSELKTVRLRNALYQRTPAALLIRNARLRISEVNWFEQWGVLQKRSILLLITILHWFYFPRNSN